MYTINKKHIRYINVNDTICRISRIKTKDKLITIMNISYVKKMHPAWYIGWKSIVHPTPCKNKKCCGYAVQSDPIM